MPCCGVQILWLMASQFKFKMVSAGVYTHARAVLVEVQGGIASPELELQVVVSSLMWVLGSLAL